MARIDTLKKRSEFLAARKGARWATRHFVLEALERSPIASEPPSGARFGFTVSKQVGGAVERNRIKRRLRAAVQQTSPKHAQSGFDYVLIARRPALEAEFSTLVSDLVTAYMRVHTGARQAPPRGRRKS